MYHPSYRLLVRLPLAVVLSLSALTIGARTANAELLTSSFAVQKAAVATFDSPRLLDDMVVTLREGTDARLCSQLSHRIEAAR
jgi:hypothetical protein